MLIKQADDQSGVILDLERLAASSGPEAKRAAEELRIRKAGLKGERESAYLIDFDFDFANSPNWAVIHDLRLEHCGRVAQIDHLLINRWMDIYVLETKHFRTGLKITEQGEFLRWDSYKRTHLGMPSPLQQNERHIAVLRDVIGQMDWPVRMGLRIAPTFQTLILVAPNARIDRPRKFDSSRVIKADQLKPRIWKDIDEENGLLGLIKTAARIVSRDTVELVARQLTKYHRPLSKNRPPTTGPVEAPPCVGINPRARIESTLSPPPSASRMQAETAPNGPLCKSCSGTRGNILYGKFGYYFKCDVCDTNTTIRFTCQPGHKPRLRKEGTAFYRECAGCNSSSIFHRNSH